MNIGIALALLVLSAGKESKVVPREEFAQYVEGANQGVVIERRDAETWVLHLRANPEKTAVFRLALLRETLGPNPERMPVDERRKTYERLLAGLLSSLGSGAKTPDRIFPRLVPSSFLDLDDVKKLNPISVPYPGPGSFVLVFVEDQPQSVRYLTRKTDPKLPPDAELKAAAFKNLERECKAKVERALDQAVRAKRAAAMWTDEYDGLRALLLLPGLLRKGEEVFVVQLRRDSLLILPPPADGKLDSYKSAATADVEVAPGMIAGLYRVTDAGFSPVR